jgi:glycosyltransferase involved in cell wall biosynthesis
LTLAEDRLPHGNRLRVAAVLPAYFEDDLAFVGGGDRYVYHLARALRESCDVTLITFGPRGREAEVDGLRHVVVPGSGRDVFNPRPRPGFFFKERFDVIHVFQLRTLVTSLLAMICRARGIPLVVTDTGGGGRSLIYRLRLYNLVPSFVLISDFSRKLLPPSTWGRAKVAKGGIDLGNFRFNEGPRKRQVVQVGRILPHKGINYLIEAAGADIPVVVAGKVMDDAYYQYLRRQSEGKRVTFMIDAADRAIADLYASSAITVSASVYRDVFGQEWPNSELLGLTLLESMAVGTPVVCTDVGGMPEYVAADETGFIVPPNDPPAIRAKLELLLGDPKLAAAMGRAGRDHVQQFSWHNVAAKVAEEYARLAGGGRRKS